MRVLLIKTSSMGDIIHTFPALTEAGEYAPAIEFDWVVEESFQEIVHWHPLVKRSIPIALRRWRKNIFSFDTYKEWLQFYHALRISSYDFVIDAQGLVKSALLSFLARGPRYGLNHQSARESLAAKLYQYPCEGGIIKEEHAIHRTKKLFANVFKYSLDEKIDYGIKEKFIKKSVTEPYIVFLHGTTWKSKHWPDAYWVALAKILHEKKIMIKIPWHTQEERTRGLHIASAVDNVTLLPSLKLTEITEVIGNASAIVSVDTGLGHIAAALDVPTVSLYGATNPALTGALGKSQIHLSGIFPCSPCFSARCHYAESVGIFPPCFTAVTANKVWGTLETLLEKSCVKDKSH